jgi:uncharacterized protein YgiM (DUF1202 family)
MSEVLAAAARSDPALAAVVAFTRRFGPETTALAMHAALPLGLSPELVHLLRVNFVRHAPFIAEADLLLSPLCTEVGGGMYEMDADVRELLLGELAASRAYGPAHVRRVAHFLRVWAIRAMDDAADADAREYLRVQQWVALAHEDPARAAEELAGALRAGVEAADRPEVARVARLTTVLSAPLAAQVELRRYAGAVERVATAGRAAIPPATGDVPIGRERLPAMDRVIRLWQPHPPTPEHEIQQQANVTDEPLIQQQSNVVDEPPIQQQTEVADESPIQQQANVTEEPPVQQQVSTEPTLTGYRVARVVVVGDDAVGKSTLIMRITDRNPLSPGGRNPYLTRWIVPAAETGGGESDVVFVEPDSDHLLPLELTDAAAIIVVVRGTNGSASEQRWKSRLGKSRPILVYETRIPEEESGSTPGMMRFGDEYVVPFLNQDLEKLRTQLLHEAIDWRAQPAAPSRATVDELEHYLTDRLQAVLVVGLEQVLQGLLMRSGGISSEQAETDLQGALLCVSARGGVRLLGEKQQQLVSGLTYAQGMELIWQAVQNQERTPPHLPAAPLRGLDRYLAGLLLPARAVARRSKEVRDLLDLLVNDLIYAGWAYRVQYDGGDQFVIPSLFQGRAHEGEQLTPGRPLLQARWIGRVQDIFVLLLVHMAQRGRLQVNSPRAAQVALIGGHVSLASGEYAQRAVLTLAAEVAVQDAEEWKQLVRDLVVRYLPPGVSPEFIDLDRGTSPLDPLQPPEGVDLTQACLVVLPQETSAVDERMGDFEAIWEHLFKPAVEDTWLPEGSSLVPVRIPKLPPPGTPLPEWTKAARLLAVDITTLDAPEIRTVISGFRRRGVVLFADRYADVPDVFDGVQVYKYVPGGPEELVLERGFVSDRLAAALQGEEDEEENEGTEEVRLELIPIPVRPRVAGQTQTVTFALVMSSERSRPTPGDFEEQFGAVPDQVLATLSMAPGATARVTLRVPWDRRDQATFEWLGRWQDRALTTVIPADVPAGELTLGFTIETWNPGSTDAQIHDVDHVFRVDIPIQGTGPTLDEPGSKGADDVDPGAQPQPLLVAIIVPRSVRAGDYLHVTTRLYSESTRERVEEGLKMINPAFDVLHASSSVNLRDVVHLRIRTPWELAVPEANRVPWTGDAIKAELLVAIPAGTAGATMCQLELAAAPADGDAPRFAEILQWRVEVHPESGSAEVTAPPRTAFASYARQDVEAVRSRMEAIQSALGLEFYDVADLPVGEDVRTRLGEEICSRDLFLLFWSRAASESEWVRNEWQHALECNAASGRPEIQIEALEEVEAESIPEELRRFHFATPNVFALAERLPDDDPRVRGPFDVVLTYSGVHRYQAREIAEGLYSRGITPWYEQWARRPGQPQLTALAELVGVVPCVVAVIGAGIRVFQQREIENVLTAFARRGATIIPVVVGENADPHLLPETLGSIDAIDFTRHSDPLGELVRAIEERRAAEVAPPTPIRDEFLVMADTLNVRSGPNASNPALGTVTRGTVLTPVAEQNGWKQITSPVAGWVNGNYLQSVGAQFVVTTTVNVRGGPGTSHSPIGTLRQGAVVTAIVEQKGWMQITAPMAGWVSAQFLQAVADAPASAEPVVVISNTLQHLPEYHALVRDACISVAMVPHMILPPATVDAVQAALAIIDGAALYIGVFGHGYGHIPDGYDKSISEMEYEQAVKRGIPRLIYILDDNARGGATEIGVENKPKLAAFKERLRNEQDVAIFWNPAQLRAQLIKDLMQFQAQRGPVAPPATVSPARGTRRSRKGRKG